MERTPVGSIGLMRQVRPDDDGRIRDFVCGLSCRSRYFRFFASAAPPSSGLLHVLCGGTGADILLVTDGAGIVIAHGMAADVASGDGLASNIGLVVTDRWQQQGLGRVLLGTLVGRAARRGACSLTLDVLPANDRMLGIIDRRWPHAPRERTRDAIIIRPAITPWQTTAGWPVPAIVRLPAQSAISPSGSAISPSGDVRAPDRSAA